MKSRYDIVVVGARPAGAGTALLLARQGASVLMIDRGRHGTDTLSTHALMRGGVLQLARWGVLPRIVAAGTPPVRQATFIYGDDALAVAVKPRDGVDALYAPRRTVLDRMLVDVAAEAGVDVAYGVRLTDLLRRHDGRVNGIVTTGEDGTVRARRGGGGDRRRRLAIADGTTGRRANDEKRPMGDRQCLRLLEGPAGGRLSLVLSARAERRRHSDQRRSHVRVHLDPGGSIRRALQARCGGGYQHVMQQAGPDLAEGMRQAALEGALHGFPGQIGFCRQSAGPGWALVGDAGYFKDPLTAHGITDALLDAEYLTRAVQEGTDAALAAYEAGRNERTRELFEVTDRIASFTWTLDEARALHKRLAEAMSAEVKALLATTLEEATA